MLKENNDGKRTEEFFEARKVLLLHRLTPAKQACFTQQHCET